MAKDDDALREGATPVGQGSWQVKQGDCIASIAVQNGFFWETLWNAPENQDLKQARKSPSSLLPGDRVHVPELRQRQEQIATGRRHTFRRKGVPARLRLRLVDAEGPRANLRFQLTIDDKTTQGHTDHDGRIDVAIPPAARSGKLELFGDAIEEYELDLGRINPVDHITGAQARLQNLGFYQGPIDESAVEETAAALRLFQKQQGIEPTGRLDAATQDALRKAHGG